MNKLKKTLALVAALAMTTTAFASCGDDPSSSTSSPSSSTSESSDAGSESSDAGSESSDTSSDAGSESSDAGNAGTGEMDASVGQGGDTLTVVAWNPDDVPKLIAQWKGIDYNTVAEDLNNKAVEGVNFVSFGVGGGEAAENYDQYMSTGADLDVYFVEADWALKYINDDSKTLALDKLGLTDADFPNIYEYTDAIGKDSNGVRKGISWQAAAGGFAYRADLAEEYLGVTSPEEMQAQVGDWDKFVTAAQTVSEKSSGAVALADSLGGMWQAYACGRTTPWVVDGVLKVDDFCKGFGDTAKTLWDINAVAHDDQWADEWTANGANGSTMGYFVSTWGFGAFFLTASGSDPATETAGEQYGKWALCQGPTPYYWGGTWIVVSPGTDNGNEAKEFILSATSDEAQMSEFAKNKPEYVNNAKVMDELIAADTTFNAFVQGNFKDNQNFYAELAETAKAIDFNGLITPYDATVKASFLEAVKDEYCKGGASWEDTVTVFEDKVLEAIQDVTVE